MQIDKKTLRNIFLGAIGCILLYWLLHDTERVRGLWGIVKGVFSPFAIGASLAFIFNVPMRGIEGLLKGVKSDKLRRILSVILTFVAVLLVLTVVFLLLIPQLTDTIQSLIPRIYNFVLQSGENIDTFLQDNPEIMSWVVENTDFETFDWAGFAQKILTILGNSVSTVVDKGFSAIGSITGAFMDAFVAIVFAIYCLFQKETLARQAKKLIYAFLPEKISDNIVQVLRLANETFSNFLSGQCVEVCILGALFAISMAIFRMPYIPLVSVLVAVTAFVPIVGAWVGCVFGAFLILVANPLQAVWFVVLFVILQQIENNLIYPRVVGTSIGLSGMWVLVAVSVGGELMGVAGMFLMIPVASVLYTLLRKTTNDKLDTMDIDPQKFVAVPMTPINRLKWIKKKPKKVQEENKE